MPRLAENDFYTQAATPALIVAVRANIILGEERLDLDAPFRHITHRTLDGVQVEYRQNPPVFVPGDRPVTLKAPVVDPATLALLRSIRLGGFGFPVIWQSNLIPSPGIQVVFYEVKSKATAGANHFEVEVTLQAL